MKNLFSKLAAIPALVAIILMIVSILVGKVPTIPIWCGTIQKFLQPIK